MKVYDEKPLLTEINSKAFFTECIIVIRPG